eukprot:NODE_854_length_2299_cov_48.321691_g728_i0.p1 GENE.NODE_854_length_2299_cov_48.321691_g728_i0~~NODE_854_length_2299_cov_48.321691_g728_i0.p1  ORF type:complete len:685 (-),score=161.29 NODE_854_length_2299_cov_48.321691_g728_i0:203-2257(-)
MDNVPIGGRTAKGPGARPQLLICYLCGQQFGSASLGIHQPQCYQKKLTEWKNADKGVRGPKPRDPSASGVEAPNKILGNLDAVERFNQEQFGDFKQNLAQCPNCGRKFFSDRLAVHLRSCNPDNAGRGSKPVRGSDFRPQSQSGGGGAQRYDPQPKGPAQKPGLLICNLCGQQFGTASLPIHQPQCYAKKVIEWERADPQHRGPRPRDPSTMQTSIPQNLRDAQAIENFNNQNFEDYNANLAPCPNCGRTFNPDRLAVHMRSCNPGASGRGSKPVAGRQLPPATYPTPSNSGPSPVTPNTNTRRSPLTNRLPSAMSGESGDFNDGLNARSARRPPTMESGNWEDNAISSEESNNSDLTSRRGTSAQYGRRAPDKPQFTEEHYAPHPEDSPPLARNRHAAKPKPKPAPAPAPDPREEAPQEEDYEDVPPVPTAQYNLEAVGDEAFEELDDENLIPCANCGRKFAAERLAKHQKACSNMKHRKVFNSTAARVKGTEMQQFVNPNKKGKEPPPSEKPKNDWKQQHEAFQEAMKQAKMVNKVIKEGGNLADLPPPPPSANPDYVGCPHCGRRFAPGTAERHIPKCAETVNRPKAPPKRPANNPPAPTAGPSSSKPATLKQQQQQPPPQVSQPPPPKPSAPASKRAANPIPPSEAPKKAANRARFCSNCGFQFGEDECNFCQECGHKRD